MTSMIRNARREPKSAVRCAAYTRKSTHENLDQDFNTLDAQREAAEAYIASQKHEGWRCLPQRYDDGGFTGGNMERPGVKRLMADIEAHQVDCVVVYKVDRLSRSLLDFARMMETFEKHDVSFVSVTQQFNTAHSMGRLTLNILLSFAQFERELISERTHDKMAAARRKGKWLGGVPVLGYNVDRQARRLIVDPEESARVVAIYELYLGFGGLIPTVQELDRRGWINKSWTTRKGVIRNGKPFNKGTLHYLLTNVTYRGEVEYQGQVYAGDHDAIVPDDLFRRVQKLFEQNRRSRRLPRTNGCQGVLQGLLHCSACESRMVHTYTTKGPRRYRYYVCSTAQKQGWDKCPTKSIPARQIEQYVMKEVQSRDQEGTAGRLELESLTMPEQAEAIRKLVRRVDYDGRRGDLQIQLLPDQNEVSP
jgi:site-specific DNA recombinase